MELAIVSSQYATHSLVLLGLLSVELQSPLPSSNLIPNSSKFVLSTINISDKEGFAGLMLKIAGKWI